MATVRSSGRRKRPLLLWSGLSGSPLPEDELPWLIRTGGEVQVATSAETTTPAQWIAQSNLAHRNAVSDCYLLKAESLMQWLNLNVLTAS